MLCTLVTVSVIVWVCFNVSSPDQTVCIEEHWCSSVANYVKQDTVSRLPVLCCIGVLLHSQTLLYNYLKNVLFFL